MGDIAIACPHVEGSLPLEDVPLQLDEHLLAPRITHSPILTPFSPAFRFIHFIYHSPALPYPPVSITCPHYLW